MRCWVGVGLWVAVGTASAASAAPIAPPIASHFDLTSSLVHAASLDRVTLPNGDDGDDRWTLHDVEPPPGPPSDPPRWHIHGKKVKIRIPLR
jgi:hypothetical protein